MAAGTYNIIAERNEALVIQFTYKDDTDTQIDLSSATITTYLKDNKSDSTVTSVVCTLPDAVANPGLFQLNLSPAAVNSITWNQGIYYIEVEIAPANPSRIIEGKFQIKNNSAY